jgi:hypothetical protein
MEKHFYIKCNTVEVGPSPYLYWSGVAWVKELLRARKFATEAEGEKELRDLSPPVIVDKKGRGPEVFEF